MTFNRDWDQLLTFVRPYFGKNDHPWVRHATDSFLWAYFCFTRTSLSIESSVDIFFKDKWRLVQNLEEEHLRLKRFHGCNWPWFVAAICVLSHQANGFPKYQTVMKNESSYQYWQPWTYFMRSGLGCARAATPSTFPSRKFIFVWLSLERVH